MEDPRLSVLFPNKYGQANKNANAQPTQTTVSNPSDPRLSVLFPNKFQASQPVDSIGQIDTQQVPQKKVSKWRNIGNGIVKFGAKTAVNALDLLSEANDFYSNLIANNLDTAISISNPNAGFMINAYRAIDPKGAEKIKNDWVNFYKKQYENDRVPAKVIKEKVDKLAESEYLQPSQEWQQSSLQEKLTTRLPETVYELGPSILSSVGIYAINPAVGVGSVVGSTANEVKATGIEYGMSEANAEKLGLGTGIVVGALDQIVPDEAFGGNALKKEFLKGLVKRLTTASLKEGVTEITQEMVQIAAETVAGKDLNLDEATERVVLSGIGGLFGGTGFQVIGDITNSAIYGTVNPDTKVSTETQEKLEKLSDPNYLANIVINEQYNQIAESAKQYTDVSKFAKNEFNASPDDTFGLVSPQLLNINTANFNEKVDVKQVQNLVLNIQQDKEVSIPVVSFKNGVFEVVKNANSATAFKISGTDTPVIVVGDAPESFVKIKDIYDEASKAKLATPETTKTDTQDLTIPTSLNEIAIKAKDLTLEEFSKEYPQTFFEEDGRFDGTVDEFYQLANQETTADENKAVDTTQEEQVTTDNADNKTYDYQSTQFNLPQKIANKIRLFAQSIPQEELAKDGRELQPHVTLMYGLDNKYTIEDITNVVGGQGSIDIELGEMKAFENQDQDVLYIEVKKGDKLEQLNKTVADNLDTPGNDFDTYTPHITLAYLKKGESAKYVGTKIFNGTKVKLNDFVFSTKDGEQISIDTAESVESLTNKLRDIYTTADQEKLGDAWMQTMAYLDIAEAGGLIWKDGKVTGGYKSTFPDFIPEELKSRKLIDSVMDGLQDPSNITLPPAKNTRQQAFYEAFLAEVDSIAGTDSSEIINQIKEAQNAEKVKQKETKKATSRSTKGSQASIDNTNKSNQTNFASTDDFADLPKLNGKNGLNATVKEIPFPEMVQIANELMDSYPVIKKPRKRKHGRPLGYFVPNDKGQIVLNPEIFSDVEQASKTMAHEIGHLIDYLPDQMINRGGILPRIAVLREFLRKTYTNDATEARIDSLYEKRTQLQAERDTNPVNETLRSLRRQLKEAQQSGSDTKANDLQKIISQTQKDRDTESNDKQLRKEIRTIDKEIKKLQKTGIKDKVVRDELWKLSKLWKPLQAKETVLNSDGKVEVITVEITEEQADQGYLNYRKSSPELYADAISVLFNDPALLKKEAPTFWNGFFENIDKKPKVKKEFLELWDKLNRESDEVITERIDNIYKGFKKARDKRLTIEQGKEDTRTLREKGSDVWHDVLFQHITRFDPIYKRVSTNKNTMGLELSQATESRMMLEEMQMRRNNSFLLLDKVQREVIQPLEQLGKDAEDDLGVFLQLSRSLGDREDIANPLGLQKQYAQETLDFFENTLKTKKGYTDEEVEIFKQIAKNFRETVFSKVEEANAVGVYSDEFFNETAKPNKDTYVTFQVVDYIHDNYVAHSIKKATGTLKQVENPLVSTLMKTVALTEAIEIQRGKQQVVSDLIENFSDEITRAEPKMIKDTRVGWKTEEGFEALELYEDGKRIAYNVDPYIAKMFDLKTLEPQEIHNLVKVSSRFNRVFKPIVTTYNLSWGFFSNISRDTRRTYKNLGTIAKVVGNKKGLSVGEFVNTWVRAIPEGYKFQKGEVTEIMREMLEAKAYQMPFTNFDIEANNESSVAPLMRKYKLLQGLDKDKSAIKRVVKPVTKILDAIEFAGGTLETTTKVAGYQMIKRRTDNTRLAGFVNRNYVGTPNFIDGGTQKQIDNNVFVFSNVMFQGVRTDLELALNPTTRSGWWMRTFMVDVLPKLAMVAGSAGLLGEAIKELFDKATEYDKTNYLVVPLGVRENGKANYLRIPQDETGRFLSALVWKMGTLLNNNLKKPEQIMALGAGYLPSPTPLFEIAGGWINYVQGNNPYDSFRGRLVIDQTTWEAGGLPAFAKMVQWTSNSLGLSQFTTYSDETDTGFDVFLKNTPILNRAFKSTDYGLTEKEREIDKKLEREKAKQTLKERELFDDALKEARATTDNDERLAIRNEFIKQVVGEAPYDSDDKRKITNLKKKFKLGVLKGSVSREMDTLIDANNNAYKVELIKLYKESLPQAEYEELIRTAYDNGVISDNVVDEIRLLNKQSSISKPNYMVYDLLERFKDINIVPQAYASDIVYDSESYGNVADKYNTVVEVDKNEKDSRVYIPGGGFFDFPKKLLDAVGGVLRGFFEIDNKPIVFAKEEVTDLPVPTAVPTPTPMPTVIPTPEGDIKGVSTSRVKPEVESFLEGTVFPVTRRYGIPDAVASGMFAAEGRNLGLGANRNNFYNIAAFDSNPNNAFTFQSPEEGVEAFAQFITGNYDRYASERHKKAFKEAFEKYKDDPVQLMIAIQNAGYAGDPATYSQRSPNNFDSYSEFVMNTPEWERYFK